jgi:hypothetical protein
MTHPAPTRRHVAPGYRAGAHPVTPTRRAADITQHLPRYADPIDQPAVDLPPARQQLPMPQPARPTSDQHARAVAWAAVLIAGLTLLGVSYLIWRLTWTP